MVGTWCMPHHSCCLLDCAEFPLSYFSHLNSLRQKNEEERENVMSIHHITWHAWVIEVAAAVAIHPLKQLTAPAQFWVWVKTEAKNGWTGGTRQTQRLWMAKVCNLPILSVYRNTKLRCVFLNSLLACKQLRSSDLNWMNVGGKICLFYIAIVTVFINFQHSASLL